MRLSGQQHRAVVKLGLGVAAGPNEELLPGGDWAGNGRVRPKSGPRERSRAEAAGPRFPERN